MAELTARRDMSEATPERRKVGSMLARSEDRAPISHDDIMRQASISDLSDEIDATLSERSLERVAELGRRARDLIGEDQFLATLMLPLAQGYVHRSLKRAERRL